MSSGLLDGPLLPLRAVRHHRLAPADLTAWPATMPPVREILREGLELGQITVLTGDNGAGKSTIVEAIAGAYGLNPEGGGTGAMHATRLTESPLSEHLQLVRGAGAAKSGFSLPGCLALLGLLRDLVAGGSQIILSTHSPVLAALPGADLYEVGEWGLRRSDYDDLELVRTWRSFLEAPQRFLRHLG